VETHGAIILCGGASKRMGRDKALLPFGLHEVLLQRVVRLLGEVVPCKRIVCVAAADQTLPQLANGVQIVRDTALHQGPLAGLATGMAAIRERADAVYLCGCDAPLLVPALVERLFEQLGDRQIAVPRINDQLHPLAAVYRADVLSVANSLLDHGERSLRALVEWCDTRFVAAAELRDVDPDLATLVGCNTPDEYQAALVRCNQRT
jgi:molybdopterin-guanine dinucleotide biosynthesis protein A